MEGCMYHLSHQWQPKGPRFVDSLGHTICMNVQYVEIIFDIDQGIQPGRPDASVCQLWKLDYVRNIIWHHIDGTVSFCKSTKMFVFFNTLSRVYLDVGLVDNGH
jgi:hypothetical protein